MTLYEIKENYLCLLNMDLDEQTMKDTLESIQGDLEEKADNIACLIKSLEAEKKAISEEVDQLMLRMAKKQVKADRLKQYLHDTFKALNMVEFETAKNIMQVKKNPVSVVLDDGFNNLIYMTEKISFSPDKKRIKEAIEHGLDIDGARLEQKERLVIK